MHVHAVFLDGVYRDKEEDREELELRALAHLTTRDVAEVLERTRDRMTKYLRRRGLVDAGGDDAEEDDASERAGLTRLAASAVSGATPPAGPEWRRSGLPRTHRAMVFELKYILRPAVAQERVTRGPDGLVRIGLKKAFSDGTVAVDLDPLSLLSRLCASVHPPRLRREQAPSRPWAELLRRTFQLDVLACPRCDGRMRLLAMVTEPKSVAR